MRSCSDRRQVTINEKLTTVIMDTSVDVSDLRKVILTEGSQFADILAIVDRMEIPRHALGRVMVSGMGGSALPANILRMVINDGAPQGRRVAVYQNRFYELPPEAYEDCLNLICSHSGNTEETIAAFEQALAAGLPCVGISAGGVIERMCAAHGVPHVKLPIPFPHFQPRMATGHFVGAMLAVLAKAGMTEDRREALLAAGTMLETIIPSQEAAGKELAATLVGATPVVYASTRFKALAMIWKIKFNENSKVPAFWNFFPELNHNEFVGFTNPQGAFHILMLRDAHDHPRNLKRCEVTKGFLEAKGVAVTIVDMPEGDLLTRIFATLSLGDWTSYYLALAYGQDPTPVAMVEDLKKALVA